MQIIVYNQISDDLINLFNNNKKKLEYYPFQDLKWIKHWYECIACKEKNVLKIFVIFKDNIPILILPFVIKNLFSFKILEWAGGICSDYHGILINKNFEKIIKSNFPTLWNNIKKMLPKIDVIHLYKQKKFENTSNPFLEFFSIMNYRHKSYQRNFTHILLDVKEKKLKKVFQDNRRQLKRIDKFGKVLFVDAENYYQKKEIIKVMIEQKKKRYIQTKTWNMFSNINYVNFYSKLADICFDEMKIQVNALVVGKEFLACHVGIIHKNIFYYLMPSYDSDNWRSYSPGNILLEYLVNKSNKYNVSIFDFTIGGEEYKKKWTNVESDLYEHLSCTNLKGYLYCLFYNIAINLKKNSFLNFYIRKLSIKIKSWII